MSEILFITLFALNFNFRFFPQNCLHLKAFTCCKEFYPGYVYANIEILTVDQSHLIQ